MQQQISPSISPEIKRSGGGRISSPKLRRSLEQSKNFEGLEENTNRYDLLLLVKRVGKQAGFTSKMIQLLDYYLAFTREIDWEEGACPIVYQCLAKTALDLGVSERQIQKLEKQLFEIGAITWNDSGNHRRYGQRCSVSGRILYAFGVDLTPLAFLRSKLENKLHEKQLHDRAWMKTKRQVSWYRAQIRAMLSELEEEGTPQIQTQYDEIAISIRTYMKLESLRDLLHQHKKLYQQLTEQISWAEKISSEIPLTSKSSCKDEEKDAHYKNTNKPPFDKSNSSKPSVIGNQESKSKTLSHLSKPQLNEKALKKEKTSPATSTGIENIRLKQALNAASDRFKAHIPINPGYPLTWRDMIEAAYSLKSKLPISQENWGNACVAIGRENAAICLLLTDYGTLRIENRVMKPGAYFRSMVNRAKTGNLNLHASIMGILKREQGDDT